MSGNNFISVSVIGLGFVGGSMKKSFEIKKVCVKGYDKYKDSDSFEDCLKSGIMFLCLPTQFDEKTKQYDKSIIIEMCELINENGYKGLVVIKSTVEPLTTFNLARQYPLLKFIHNPEFLTASTAFEDFHNQKHIVLGKSMNVSDKEIETLVSFYKNNYLEADINLCSCTESESMKIFVNCFYSVKVQFFTELFLLCKSIGCEYNTIVELMLKNEWINPMHTQIPGPDGKISYGGFCFPKDTNALLGHMIRNNTPHLVLESTIKERNEMRDDNVNIIIKKDDDE